MIWQRADRREVLGTTRFFEAPDWRGDSQSAVLWAPMNRLAAQVAVASIGEDANAVRSWFNDSNTIPPGSLEQDLGPGRLTRAGDRLAAIRADGAQLALYDARAGFGVPPTGVCLLTNPVGAFGDPTWAPDGSALAWAEGSGIVSTAVAPAATMAGGLQRAAAAACHSRRRPTVLGTG
ncbi:MAG: hypothetical protein JO363_14045 [Solirubrobacterales bacterium]|nr:hypothetical protein [Solirubrobacterales bacterium]